MNAPGEAAATNADVHHPVIEQPATADQGRLADAVANAARAVPGVVGLHTGTFGEIATYLAGRRVEGVQIRPDGCAVHLVLAWGAPVLATADLVRAVVAPLVGTPVDISIEDVLDPSFHSSEPSTVSSPGSGGRHDRAS
ncbi:hypothetical protein [Pengzhenrongella frigida]|uniref:hypothetical protein n=1 Tax=Pengzhenrongella frigida TaxID=1259133 RepID=UPI001A9253F5|nr:hypothetical protein [Cellulomonas sp. HLT2-17]